MISVVLLMAVTAGSATPDYYGGGCGTVSSCYGGGYGGGCYGGGCYGGGCYGGGCYGVSYGGGCYGGSCYGGGCYGGSCYGGGCYGGGYAASYSSGCCGVSYSSCYGGCYGASYSSGCYGGCYGGVSYSSGCYGAVSYGCSGVSYGCSGVVHHGHHHHYTPVISCCGTPIMGGSSGYSGSGSGSSGESSDKDKDKKKKRAGGGIDDTEEISAQPATLVVSLPANASLSIGGSATTSTSSERKFTSPALQPGKVYTYAVEAKFEKDGKTKTVTRTARVEAGKVTRIDLNDTPVSVASK